MDLILQIWGGGCYLLNKILLSLAEGRSKRANRKLRIAGWIFYLFGVPAWVIILIGQHNWIAASIEAGGIPAMLFGLLNVYQAKAAPDKVFDAITSSLTYAFVILGISYSLYDYGGLVAVSQLLEISAMTGFLVGSYLLAKNDLKGWLLFMLMNGSMASLMYLQHKPILAVQQLVSLCFGAYGFMTAVRRPGPGRLKSRLRNIADSGTGLCVAQPGTGSDPLGAAGDRHPCVTGNPEAGGTGSP